MNQVGYQFRKLKYDLKAFKKLSNNKLANLIIPKDEIIGFNTFLIGSQRGFCKMRTTKAYVHSIVDKYTYEEVEIGSSLYDPCFTYKKGKYVDPIYKFSKIKSECNSGIHFFITLREAYEY